MYYYDALCCTCSTCTISTITHEFLFNSIYKSLHQTIAPMKIKIMASAEGN